MKLAEYQPLALKTALPRALDLRYVVPGTISEIGELFGQEAKAYRDDWDAETLAAAVNYEYGDVVWMTGVGLSLFSIPETQLRYGTNLRGLGPKEHLLEFPTYLWAAYADNPPVWLDEVFQGLWNALEIHCEAITGHDIDFIQRLNLDKLAKRAAKGTLEGSGDYR